MSKPTLQGLTLEEELLIYSWFYKLGDPLVSDGKFNFLYSKLKQENPSSPLVTTTWSELQEPTELLQRTNYFSLSEHLKRKNLESNSVVNSSIFFMPEKNMILRSTHLKETRDYFNQFIPKSIDSIESEQASQEWLDELLGEDTEIEMNFSLKIDGWFSDAFYYKGSYIGAFTRGRGEGDSKDISIALSHVMPMEIETDETYVSISVESAMYKSSLDILRKMDPTREWKSHRNSMSTLLMNSLSKKYYDFIVPFGHGVKGIDFDTAEEMYQFIQQQGIQPSPNMTLTIKSTEEIVNFIQAIGSMSLDIPSDGIVVRVNKTEQYQSYDTVGKYDTAIRAYRLFEWKSDIYVSVVTNITTSDNAKYISLALQIMPTKVSNGSEISTLDADNLDRILRSGVSVGSLVAFHMRSDSCVDWLDYSTRYIEKCAEYNIPMEPSFVKALEKFKHTLSEKMNLDVHGAIDFINSKNLLEG